MLMGFKHRTSYLDTILNHKSTQKLMLKGYSKCNYINTLTLITVPFRVRRHNWERIWCLMNPNRLAGAVLIAPVINYWWSGLPANLSNEAFKWKPLQDQWALSVAHYTPWLTYWWNTQRWFPVSSLIAHNPDILSPNDKILIPKLSFRREYMVSILLSRLTIPFCFYKQITWTFFIMWRNREKVDIEQLIRNQTWSLFFEQLIVY